MEHLIDEYSSVPLKSFHLGGNFLPLSSVDKLEIRNFEYILEMKRIDWKLSNEPFKLASIDVNRPQRTNANLFKF